MVIHLKNECLLNTSLGQKEGQATEWGAKGGWSWDDDEPVDYEDEI